MYKKRSVYDRDEFLNPTSTLTLNSTRAKEESTNTHESKSHDEKKTILAHHQTVSPRKATKAVDRAERDPNLGGRGTLALLCRLGRSTRCAEVM